MRASTHIYVNPKISKSISVSNFLNQYKKCRWYFNLEAAQIRAPVLVKLETITNFFMAYGVLVIIASVFTCLILCICC